MLFRSVPNANNLSDEMTTIQNLAVNITRSNTGQVSYVSSTSATTYNTVDYPSDSTIYNKGQTGLYNLLVKQLGLYMLTAEDVTVMQGYSGNGSIITTGWTSNTGNYAYKLSVSITNATSFSNINVYIEKDSIAIAQLINLCPTNESYDGGVTFYAKKVPTVAIPFSYKF